MRLPTCLILAIALAGCQAPQRRPSLGERAHIPELRGFAGVRAVNGYPSSSFQTSFAEGLARRAELWRNVPATRSDYDILVLGAGGPNGSFGAGLLTGWTASGQRPEFDIVTGVSAGALLAPFAFVGSRADAQLNTWFGQFERQDIYRARGALAGLFGESLTDSGPLWGRIVRSIDMPLMEAIAEGHEQGRRLYIGTTDFDVGQLVVWDIGAIAVQRSESALDLVRRVLLATSSIPVFYPPVLFEVHDAEGAVGDEMHVDGSITSPMFLPHLVFDAWLAAEQAQEAGPIEIEIVLHVVHNGSLVPSASTVERDTVEIAAKSLSMVAASMVQEDVLHLYLLSRVWGAEFRFARIPDGAEVSVLEFGAEDTRRLFELGHERGCSPESWADSPPDFLVSDELREIQPVLPTPYKRP